LIRIIVSKKITEKVKSNHGDLWVTESIIAIDQEGEIILRRIEYIWFLLLILYSPYIYSTGNKENNNFPNHPITLIVPYAENGGTDVIARALGFPMEKILGQPIIIENKLGGSGAAGMISGVAAIPDGYTLTMITREVVSLPALGLAEISRDDFKLLALINKDPAVLVVSGDSPYTSLDQLVREAKDRPGKIKFASPAKPHFYILEFENSQNIIFNKIPYNGAAMAIPAVINGQADFALVNPGELWEELKIGRVQALAVMANQRTASMPNVPTFKELGYDITSFTWRGLGVPSKTPETIRKVLEDTVEQAFNDPSFAQIMQDAKYSREYFGSDDFSDFIDQDIKTIKAILERVINPED